MPAMLPIYDSATDAGRAAFEQRLRQLKQTASASSEAAATVAAIVADVAQHGDEAVVDYMRRWTDPGFSADRIRVAVDELAAAEAMLDPALREAIAAAINHVTRYQQHIKPADSQPIEIDGAVLGLRWTPVDSVGLCVPGGAAVLFSTLIMLAAPALVAGVPASRISVISPPPTRQHDADAPGDISPIVLATCRMLGIERVYRIGGAQGVAALAHGTASVEPVDLIAGPGNVYVQLAKQQVSGVTGTDNGFYGPSEIVTIADDSADPRKIASDLVAQAEHDPGKCFLIAWDRAVIERIVAEVTLQAPKRLRFSAIKKAMADESCAVLVADEDAAAVTASTLAAEHVNLAVKNPQQWLTRIRHGGEFFLSDATPVAAGDYYAGPSHCLPTGTTARFTSGISVHTFLKRSGTVAYPQGMPPRAIEDIARLATAEGLEAHAESVRARLSV
jgi:histidinol dehydrogenase